MRALNSCPLRATRAERFARNGTAGAFHTISLSQRDPHGSRLGDYFLIHRAFAQLPKTGNYVLHFNKSILKSIAIYCDWSLVPESAERAGRSHHAIQLALIVEVIAIIAFIVAELRRGNRRLYFYFAWFAIVLAPMLPLTEHRVNYYIMIPVMGLAMLGGEATAKYWRASAPKRAVLAVTLLAYFCAMIPSDLAATHWWFEETQKIRAVYLGAMEARQLHLGKADVLDGITSDLFILALAQVQFNAGHLEDVYLTPESAKAIDPTVPDRGRELRLRQREAPSPRPPARGHVAWDHPQ